jgi:hypothetical protein
MQGFFIITGTSVEEFATVIVPLKTVIMLFYLFEQII